MKKIKCREYTELDCDYETEGSINEKVKANFKKHLEGTHYSLFNEKMELTEYQIREVIGRVDTKFLSRNTEQEYSYNKV